MIFGSGGKPFALYRDRLSASSATVSPVPLAEYAFSVEPLITFAEHRLTLDPLREFRDRSRRLWLMSDGEHRVVRTSAGPVTRKLLADVIRATLAENRRLVLDERFRGGIPILLYTAP